MPIDHLAVILMQMSDLPESEFRQWMFEYAKENGRYRDGQARNFVEDFMFCYGDKNEEKS
jgi:hypothetical protein